MSLAAALATAVAVVAGALFPFPVPLAVALAGCLAAVMWRRGALLAVGAGLLASCLSNVAWTALDTPLPPFVHGNGKVVRDPERMNGAVRADVSIDGRRYQVWCRGPQAQALFGASSGSSVTVSGSTTSLSGKAVPSLRRRHVAGRVDADAVVVHRDEAVLDRVANRWRSLVAFGANSLDDSDHALLMGLVFGDDRAQSEAQQEAFRDSGLSHLLAVSGQNVAFLLLLLQPVVRKFDLPLRVGLSGLALLIFGTATRWEPSVVRAVIMASVVLAATLIGRRIHPWRTLALAVSAAVLIDPFLAGSIGFLLSVTACCGMALLGNPLARRLPGPATVRVALGFTMAAQIGVAPVQVVVFGDMPVVALITNLLAAPLAAFTMMWGMTAGLLAGVVGGHLAEFVHVPTSFSVTALDRIATWGAKVSLTWNLGLAATASVLMLMAPVRHSEGGLADLVGPRNAEGR